MKLKTFASVLLAAAVLAVPAADAWAKKPKHHATATATSHTKHGGVKASQHAGATKGGKKHSAKAGKSKAAKHHKKHV